jgi:hypothetical protein
MPTLVSRAPALLGVRERREAEVDELHEVTPIVPLREEDVLGLHVAVDDARAVHGVERGRDLIEEAEDALVRRLAARHRAEQRHEIRPVDVLHDEERLARLEAAEIQRADDVRVAELRGRARASRSKRLRDSASRA